MRPSAVSGGDAYRDTGSFHRFLNLLDLYLLAVEDAGCQTRVRIGRCKHLCRQQPIVNNALPSTTHTRYASHAACFTRNHSATTESQATRPHSKGHMGAHILRVRARISKRRKTVPANMSVKCVGLPAPEDAMTARPKHRARQALHACRRGLARASDSNLVTNGVRHAPAIETLFFMWPMSRVG